MKCGMAMPVTDTNVKRKKNRLVNRVNFGQPANVPYETDTPYHTAWAHKSYHTMLIMTKIKMDVWRRSLKATTTTK